MRMKTVWFLLVVMSVCASVAHAQFEGLGGMPQQKTVVFGIGGGASVPTADAGDFLEDGFNGIAYVRFQPAWLGGFALGVNVTFSEFDFSDAEVSTSVPGVTGTQQVLAGLADMRVDLMQGKFRPYIIAGLGAYNLKTEVDGGTGGEDSTTRFGINGGGGIALKFGRVSAFIQARVDNVYTDEGFIDTDTIQIVPVSAGIEF